MYENTKAKGDAAELAVLCFLKNNGYAVSIPFGENAPYDMVVESPTHQLYRIQVRWATWKKNVLCLSLRMVSKNYCKTLDLSRIDAFVAWDGTETYIVPGKALRGYQSAFRLRKSPPKNGQKKRIHMAADYKGNLDHIP